MQHWLERIGMPPQLALGYLGVVIFMMGDGLEAAWLQDYLVNNGLTPTQAAWIFTGYGLTVAIGSWFSGVLTEALGPIRTMLAGALLFVLGTVLFIPVLASEASFYLLLLTYPLRGFAYPMFAYSFLVVVAQVAPQKRLGSAVGWFWFCFTGGYFVLGAQYSDLALSVLHIEPIPLLWTGLIFITTGTAVAVYSFVRTQRRHPEARHAGHFDRGAMLKGLTIAFENPKIGLGGMARVINTVSTYGFIAFMPNYMQQEIGYSQSEWLQIWGMLFFSNIVANLAMGLLGDRLGWRPTIMWGGGLVCMIAVLGFYYLPALTGSFWVAMSMSILLGVGLAGFVPLSALMPSLAPEHKGAAISILNLGAGLSAFVGTGLVGLLLEPIGIEGIIWVFAALYAVSIVLVYFMKFDNATHPRTRAVKTPPAGPTPPSSITH